MAKRPNYLIGLLLLDSVSTFESSGTREFLAKRSSLQASINPSFRLLHPRKHHESLSYYLKNEKTNSSKLFKHRMKASIIISVCPFYKNGPWSLARLVSGFSHFFCFNESTDTGLAVVVVVVVSVVAVATAATTDEIGKANN